MPDLFISREQAEDDLLAAAAFLAERIKSSDGHAEAMATVLPMYLTRGDMDLAAELANAVSDPHSRDKLLIKVAERCAMVDDDEYAIQLADAIDDHGLRSDAFERIGFVMAHKGKSAAALEIADMMNHPDLVYSAVAVHQAASGNEAGADETLTKIEFSSAMASTLQSIADAQLEKGEKDKAVLSLQRAAESADEIEHEEERIRTLCEIGSHFVEAGQNDLAAGIFSRARSYAEILDNAHKDILLVSCAVGFLQAGDDEMADETLDLVSDGTQLASALLVFARESWRKDEKTDAVDALDEARDILRSQKESQIRDSRSRNSIMSAIAVQYALFEKADRAVEIAQDNPDPKENWSALSQIAQVLTMHKKDDLARDTIDQIGDDSSKVSALIMLSDAKQRLDESDASTALLNEAVTWAESVPQPVARSSAMIEISSRLATKGMADRVREIGLVNLQTISEIRDESSQAVALANLSEVYEKAGLEVGEEEGAVLAGILAKS